jgi:hypothetical protein
MLVLLARGLLLNRGHCVSISLLQEFSVFALCQSVLGGSLAYSLIGAGKPFP